MEAKKCVYGLNEAARMWYLRVSNELVSIGMTKSKYDEAIFFWHCHDKLQGVMSAHVDDFFWAGTDQFKTMVIQKLTKQFQISCENQETFRYLGINVKQQNNKIYIDQEAYAETIEMVNIQGESSLNRELTTLEHENLRSAVGQLLWISNQTRPDVSFEACVLSNSLKQATVAEIFRANKVIKKVKQNETMMTFSKINNIENV